MLDNFVSRRVLTIGVSYKHPRGGVAMVMNVYSRCIYSRFRCIVNSGGKKPIYKLWKALYAYVSLFLILLFDRKTKIVHIHTASYNSFRRSAYFVKLAKFFSRQVVLHVHGGGFKEYYQSAPDRITTILDVCDVIVVLSESWRLFFQGITSSLVRVVNNVVVKPIPSIETHRTNKLNVLFLGLIAKEKGIFDLVQMIGKNVQIFRGKLVLHIGGNGNVKELERLILRYGIDDIVHYHGWVSGEAKDRLLSQSDVYVLPSYTEGLPMSILEAMAYRMPIVATPVGGIPEIVRNGENGYLVSPGDETALLGALRNLVMDKTQCIKMGDISYSIVEPYFPESVEKQLLDVYRNLLKNERIA